MAEELQEALLVRSREAEWDKVEDGTQTASSITVQQLIRQDPNNVIQYISNSGVSKLGEFKIEVCASQFADVRGWPSLCCGVLYQLLSPLPV